ncbi:cytidylyltransferase domain-containing protein [Syntrophomonas curvata]
MKTGFLITARLKSSRLPLKILRGLKGKTVIERIIDRAREVRDISEIVLCTSADPQDKPLVDIAQKNGIYYFNGSEDDVLQRLLDAARFFNMDYFLSITADNPLFSIYYANLTADTLKRQNKDFVKTSGLPIGAGVYGLKTRAVETVCCFKSLINTEIWGYLIDRPEIFTIGEIKAAGKLNRPDLRLTLDYEEDYQLINNVYSRIPFDQVLDLDDVIDYLVEHPAVARSNQNCVQLDLDELTKREIDHQFSQRQAELLSLKDRFYP